MKFRGIVEMEDVWQAEDRPCEGELSIGQPIILWQYGMTDRHADRNRGRSFQ
jgi:hypothetical protein